MTPGGEKVKSPENEMAPSGSTNNEHPIKNAATKLTTRKKRTPISFREMNAIVKIAPTLKWVSKKKSTFLNMSIQVVFKTNERLSVN